MSSARACTDVHALTRLRARYSTCASRSRVHTLAGHINTLASLALSPNGAYLLSPSFSSHTLIHDVHPFSPSPSRIHRVLQGALAGFENTL